MKETVRGIVPSPGVAVMSTTRGGGGGGGVGVTITVAVWFPVSPPVSFTSIVILYVPGTANWCCAVASVDHAVSQVPSLSQSHRTWSRLGGSWASNEVEVNVKTVDGSPLAGVQLKFAYGGVFVGGGGGGGGAVTMTVAVRFAVNPPVSSTSTVTLSLPGTANSCCAMASCDHAVSQTPSFSQSHRIWSRFDGSWASNEVDVNVKTVDVSPLAGVQLKFAYGGVFVGGGGGGGGGKGTVTPANAGGVPPVFPAFASVPVPPRPHRPP